MTQFDEPIRPAKLSEAEAIRECVRAAYAVYRTRMKREPAPIDSDYVALINTGNVYVLPGDKSPRGILVLVRRDDHFLIENVAVDPSYQRQGLGRKLIAFAEREAMRAGLHELRLYTNEVMTENLAYYGKLGFQETGRRIEDGYSRVFLSKRLATMT